MEKYTHLLNRLTKEALKKFLKIHKIHDINQKNDKEEIMNEIIEKLKDSSFKNNFIDYFNKIEKGGRKDFWIYKVSPDVLTEKNIDIRKCVNELETEDNKKIYFPEGETRYYFKISNNNDMVEIKAVQQKESINRNESEDYTTQDGKIFKCYIPEYIRHVTYYRIIFKSDFVYFLFGVEPWGLYLRTNLKLKLAFDDFEAIFKVDMKELLVPLDIENKTKSLLEKENVITKIIDDKVKDNAQAAKFTISKENPKRIRAALNSGDLNLQDIKTNYIEQDVKDHEVLQAALKENIELEPRAGQAFYFFESNLTNECDYFKFEIIVSETRIKIFNDDTTIEELENVFSYFI